MDTNATWGQAMKRPIKQAYVDTGAWDVSCPHCGAKPGQWCLTDDGQSRRVPCVARVFAGGVLPGSDDKCGRDPSEPSHPRGDIAGGGQ